MASIGELILSSVSWFSASCAFVCSSLIQRTNNLARSIFSPLFDAGWFRGFWSQRKVEHVENPSLPEGEGSRSPRRDIEEDKEEEPASEKKQESDPTIEDLLSKMTPEDRAAQESLLTSYAEKQKNVLEDREIIAEQKKEGEAALLIDRANKAWENAANGLKERMSQSIELLRGQIAVHQRALREVDFFVARVLKLSGKEIETTDPRIESIIKLWPDQSFLNLFQLFQQELEKIEEMKKECEHLNLSDKQKPPLELVQKSLASVEATAGHYLSAMNQLAECEHFKSFCEKKLIE